MRITHVITTTDIGGAEVLLQRLAQRLPDHGITGTVVCLAAEGVVAPLLHTAGWPVQALDMRPGRVDPRGVLQLRRALARAGPDVVHTWMYHADLLGGLTARSLSIPVIWSLHQADLGPGDLKRGTRAVLRACSVLSHVLPAAIASTSHAGAASHAALGYSTSRMTTISSAFDVGPIDPRARERLRLLLRLPADAPVVGCVARNHPQKNYPGFLAAVAQVLRARPDVHAVAIGPGVAWDAVGFGDAHLLDVRPRIHLLGGRLDAGALAAGFDVAVSASSWGESTPLAIGEAMAAGVPVVATDVGDCRRLVGSAGRLVAPRDADRLARAVLDLLDLPALARRRQSEDARERIRTHFSLETMTRRYAALYSDIAVRAGPDRRRRLLAPRSGRAA